jgi:hypothetical protein
VATVFARTVWDLKATGKITVVNPNQAAKAKHLVGYDLGNGDECVYLIPEEVYKAVDSHRKGLGKPLGVSAVALGRALKDRGLTKWNHGNLYEKRITNLGKRSYWALKKPA